MTALDPGILDDLKAHPENDELRLIAADFFDDQGDTERGEFIRLQIEIERKPSFRAPEVDLLRLREFDLLHRHRKDWFQLLGRWYGFGDNGRLRWWPVASNEDERRARGQNVPIMFQAVEGTPRRGFLDSLVLSAKDWLRHADAITKTNPIREVTLTIMPNILWEFSDGVTTAMLEGGREVIHMNAIGTLESVVVGDLLKAEWPTVKTWHLPT